MKKMKLFALILSIVLAAAAAGCSSETQSGSTGSTTAGNTNGNLVNLGYAAKSGDWIYYCNTVDNYKLYKIKADGTGKTKLNDDKSMHINVVGDWVYYLNYSDPAEDHIARIYRMKTDGTSKAKLSDDGATYLNVIGDQVYYLKFSDTAKLHEMKSDGTAAGTISLTGDSSEITEMISIADGYLYFNIYGTKGPALYKIKADGTGKTKLMDSSSSVISVDGDWIYYVDRYSATDASGETAVMGKLYKMKADGTGKTVILEQEASDISVDGEWIYYANYSEGKGYASLYKIKTDGTGNSKLSDDRVAYINVAGDWIYYQNDGDKGKLYRIKTDGSGRAAVE